MVTGPTAGLNPDGALKLQPTKLGMDIDVKFIEFLETNFILEAVNGFLNAALSDAL